MLCQNLGAHYNQDDAAEDLCLGLVSQTKDIADFDSRDGEHKGGYADEATAGMMRTCRKA